MNYEEFLKENKYELIEYINDAIFEFEDRHYSIKIQEYLIKALNEFFKETKANLKIETKENYLLREFKENNSLYKVRCLSQLANEYRFSPHNLFVVLREDSNNIICSLYLLMDVFDAEYRFNIDSGKFCYFLLKNKYRYDILFSYLVKYSHSEYSEKLGKQLESFVLEDLSEEMKDFLYEKLDSFLSESLDANLTEDTIKLLFESLQDYFVLVKFYNNSRLGFMTNIHKEVSLNDIIQSSFEGILNVNEDYFYYYLKLGNNVYGFGYIDNLFIRIGENIYYFIRYMIENFYRYNELWHSIVKDLGKDEYFSKILIEALKGAK